MWWGHLEEALTGLSLNFVFNSHVKGRRENGIEYVLIVIINFSQQLACFSKFLHRTWYWNGTLENDFISFHWKLLCVSAFQCRAHFALQLSKTTDFPFKTHFLYQYICLCVFNPSSYCFRRCGKGENTWSLKVAVKQSLLVWMKYFHPP